uniref:Uncharacterized protein n=1 Tax=Arundo donax TaxID=35708 RepID=A0A0A9CCU7_ARUDO
MATRCCTLRSTIIGRR